MTVYVVNRKYYLDNLETAIEKAKEIIQSRANQPINNNFKITEGKHNGYCVTLLDSWYKVGNINLLRVSIQTIKIEK